MTGLKTMASSLGGALLSVAMGAAVAQGPPFALKDGSTVVFYGDSITAQRLYTRDVEEFVLTRYPGMNIRFVNAGVPGDSVNGGYAGTAAERVRRDVAPFHPSMITLMLGMNDGGYGQGSPEIDAAFQKGIHALIDDLEAAAPGTDLTLISPTPYDEITHGTEFPGYSRVIDQFSGEIARMAESGPAAGKSLQFADFHRPMVRALERAKAESPDLAPLIIPDRIHPSACGHWIMAAALLSAWHVNPIVSQVDLDAKKNQLIASRQAEITGLDRLSNGLSWTERDSALPLPFDFNDAMTPLLLKISSIADLDQEILRVESLEPGQYQLLIDGKRVAEFSGGELERGVNLALYKTPMLEQAREIGSQEDERMALDRARFILSADLKPNAGSTAAQEQIRRSEDEFVTAIRKGVDPRPHHFELKRM